MERESVCTDALRAAVCKQRKFETSGSPSKHAQNSIGLARKVASTKHNTHKCQKRRLFLPTRQLVWHTTLQSALCDSGVLT